MKNGKIQELKVKRMVKGGAFLEDKDGEEIYIPRDELDEDLRIGDKLNIFIYKDRGRLIGTNLRPYGQVGDIVELEVTDKTKIGAFLDLGIKKDVLLPFSESNGRVEKGKKYLVALYLDKSERLCASMKLQKFLDKNPTYKEGQIVKARIYSIVKGIGAFATVEDKYNGLIRQEEIKGVYTIGSKLNVRVEEIMADGNIVLSLKDKKDKDLSFYVNKIYRLVRENDGHLNYGYEISNEKLKELDMDRAIYIKSIESLIEEDLIEVKNNSIKLI